MQIGCQQAKEHNPHIKLIPLIEICKDTFTILKNSFTNLINKSINKINIQIYNMYSIQTASNRKLSHGVTTYNLN